MTATIDHRSAVAHPRDGDPTGTEVPAPGLRTLVLEVRDGGDPVRFARIVSSMVNNTRVALAEVTVAGVPVFPVPVSRVPAGDGREARFWLRDAGHALDRLLTEEVVEIVSSAYRVISVRREP